MNAAKNTTRRLLGMVEVVADQREQITALRAENERMRQSWGEMPYPSDVEIARQDALATLDACPSVGEALDALAAFDDHGDYEAPVAILRRFADTLPGPALCLDCGKPKSEPGVPAICNAWHEKPKRTDPHDSSSSATKKRGTRKPPKADEK